MPTSSEILNELENFKNCILLSLQEVDKLDFCNKSYLKAYLTGSNEVNQSSVTYIQATLDYMYEKINIGNWKEGKPFLRKTITIASYLKLLIYLRGTEELSEAVVQEAYKIIDFGILFGCPLEKEPNLLQNCARILLSVHLPVDIDSKHIINLEIESNNIQSNKFNAIQMDTLDCPNMELFYKNYVLKEQPVVLDNCINHWPALKKWQDCNYFLKVAGMRTVSIEIGSKYTEADWTQKLMTIGEFIQNHIYETKGPTGYLAQYQLFDHIPELKNDIMEPEYCGFSDTDDPVEIMAWFGPKGTVSPLHHDPKKNLLAQVVGEKRIFLYAPSDSEYLYPYEHELLNNTARVDPRAPSLKRYPNYVKATPYYCVLKPGQLLFIPPKWWHFVESLSVSFSVSFWWE